MFIILLLFQISEAELGVAERKEREKERRREEIITAAEQVFFSKGVDTATMDEVSEAAELSKATLYLYFSSKEELYFAIFLRGQRLMSDYINKATGMETDTRKRMHAFASSIIAFQRKYANYFDAFFYFLTHGVNLASDSHYLKAHEKTSRELLERWIQLVQEGKRDQIINENLDEMRTGAILWMQLIGFLKIFTVLKKDMKQKFHISDKNIVADYTEMIFNGMLKKWMFNYKLRILNQGSF